MEVICGAPPAEYGDKTSLVIDVTTRSGQGVTTPHGSGNVFLRYLRHRDRRFQPGIWRTEVGELYLGRMD